MAKDKKKQTCHLLFTMFNEWRFYHMLLVEAPLPPHGWKGISNRAAPEM